MKTTNAYIVKAGIFFAVLMNLLVATLLLNDWLPKNDAKTCHCVNCACYTLAHTAEGDRYCEV